MPHFRIDSQFSRRAIRVYALMGLVFLSASNIRAQDEQIATGVATLDPDIAAQVENTEYWLLTPDFGDLSLEGVIEDFQNWQREDLPIAPPSADYILYAQRDALRVFDPTNFPAQVIAGLVPESYRDMVYVS